MKEKIYLVCQRSLLKVTAKRSIWSDFSPMSCHMSFDIANSKVLRLREQAEKYNFTTVDYMVRTMFVED